MRKLKVYGWQGYRGECPPAPNGNRQTREIVATTSMREVARIMDTKVSSLFNLHETGNADDIAQAMSKPGTVFWRPLDAIDRRDWRTDRNRQRKQKESA